MGAGSGAWRPTIPFFGGPVPRARVYGRARFVDVRLGEGVQGSGGTCRIPSQQHLGAPIPLEQPGFVPHPSSRCAERTWALLERGLIDFQTLNIEGS